MIRSRYASRPALIALATLAAWASGAGAQRVATAGSDLAGATCASLRGVRIAAWSDSSPPASSVRTTIDTVVAFDIAERSWNWSSLHAVVAAGLGSGGRDTAGAVAQQWHACAGAVLGMERASLLLRGATGRVHLKVDLSSLARLTSTPIVSVRRNP
jgi:hypothetical protein